MRLYFAGPLFSAAERDWNEELAAALGVTPEPPKWKASAFDRVYVISYHDGKAALATSRYDSR